MLVVGLTGGIGSGKTTVAEIFEGLKIPVFYADEMAKVLMVKDEQTKRKIIKLFGKEAYIGQELNRSYISGIVFKDPKKLTELNNIVHPATIEFTKFWVSQQTGPFVIKEAALLFESKSDHLTDLVIGVKSPLELRIKRTMERNKTTRQEVERIISNQMNEEEKLSKCDFIINNDGDIFSLLPQVIEVYNKIIDKTL